MGLPSVVGHEKTKLFKFFYQRHTGDHHHTFFVDHAMEYEMVLDWRVVIFPIALLVATMLFISVPGALVSWFVLGGGAGPVDGDAGPGQGRFEPGVPDAALSDD